MSSEPNLPISPADSTGPATPMPATPVLPASMPATDSSRRRVGSGCRALLLAASLAAFLACAPGGTPGDGTDSEPELVVEDVPEALHIPTEDDVQEAPRQATLVGVMPSAFPPDLPIHLPSSLLDFGEGETGPWVELQSPDGRSVVEADLRRKARSGGWAVSGSGSTWTLEQANRRVRLELSSAPGGAGTLYRYVY